jgi:threonine/homoserine/homoserine lactone efflux protein
LSTCGHDHHHHHHHHPSGIVNQLLGLSGFALVASITPGPNNSLLLASGIRFGFGGTVRHVLGTAMGMGALLFAMAAGVGAVLLAVPGAELAVKLAGSAYLLYLAFGIARGHGAGGAIVSRPLGVLAAAGFQFGNPKAWLFGFAAAGTFLPPGLGPVTRALVVAATCVAVILVSASLWAAGGAALSRLVSDGPAQRRINLALAVLLAASVAFIWI